MCFIKQGMEQWWNSFDKILLGSDEGCVGGTKRKIIRKK